MARRYRPTLSNRLDDLHTNIGLVRVLAKLTSYHMNFDALPEYRDRTEVADALAEVSIRLLDEMDASTGQLIEDVNAALARPGAEVHRAAG